MCEVLAHEASQNRNHYKLYRNYLNLSNVFRYFCFDHQLVALMTDHIFVADIERLLNETLDSRTSDTEVGQAMSKIADLPASPGAICAVVRRLMALAQITPAPGGTIDVCGTGGDHRNTLNVSTAVAFVAAACGAKVAKHGNRAATSRSGATDVLDALGISTSLPPDMAIRQLEQFGLTFLNAARYHPALARLAPYRRALGRPSIFNLVGPLLNPFAVTRQLIGVYPPGIVPVMAEAARRLGRQCVWVVSSGTDELSVLQRNFVVVMQDDAIVSRALDEAHFGVQFGDEEGLTGGDPLHNAKALLSMLEGARGVYRDTVILNAAAALVVAQRADDIPAGIIMAGEAIDNGSAHAKLRQLQDAYP
jgi:anthranilate phosphoribosyltransferase